MDRFLITDEARPGITFNRKVALKFVDGEFMLKYDDSQERDENGRWTSSGGGSMPYELTPQTEDKKLYYISKGRADFHDLVGTPEQNVRTFLATQATIQSETFDNPNEALRAILEDPDAPKPPLTVEELNRGVQETYKGREKGWETFEDVPENFRDQILEEVIRGHAGEEKVQAYYAEQREFVHEKMNDLVLPDGRTVGETMDLMADDSLKLLQEMAQTAPLSLTMPDSRLAKFLADERYKTVFEVTSPGKGAARGAYLEARNETETRLGVPANTAAEDRPVYATLGGTGSAYGNVTVTMDDSLKERTTITIGDSIDGAVTGYFNMGDLASGNVSREDFWANVGDRIHRWAGNDYVSNWWNYNGEFRISGYKGVEDITQMGANRYLEAQIHGGLNLSDVTSITVNPDYKISGGNQSKLDSLGITVNRVQSTWTKD